MQSKTPWLGDAWLWKVLCDLQVTFHDSSNHYKAVTENDSRRNVVILIYVAFGGSSKFFPF